LTPRFAKILQGVVKFKSAGHVTLGFFPFNACPFDVFHFNCVARSNSTASIAQSICEGQSFTFGSQVLTSAGTYTRTIPSANGCDSVITLTLSYYPTPNSLVSASGSLNFCRGGQVNLQVNNIAGQQYQWYRNGSILTSATNANFTVTETGNYSVTITNVHGCTATSSSTQVVVYENPVATVSAGGPTTFCQGGSVVLNANLGPGLTYKWLNSGLEITGAVQPSYVATAAGSYALQVTNASGCSAISGSIALGVLPIRSTDTTDTSCQGSRYYFGGQSLSASGPYWDTLVASNGCDSVIMLTLTVVSNNTIALSSAAGTDTQTVTVNTPMTNITYSTSGATGATVSGLPAGVSGSWANNTVTISGTPTATATGIFNYTVTMTGGCTGGTNTATGTIVVNQRSSGPGSSNR
jgi:mannan endo-1,4-beta-mannosidase